MKFVSEFKDILDNKRGFYDFFVYNEGTGFSVKKNLKKSDNSNVSMLSFYIPNDLQEKDNKRSIFINAIYGEKSQYGVSVRSGKIELFNPTDLMSQGEYYYDAINNKILKGNKEITPIDFINEIYNDHIKLTKFLDGFWLRVKIIFFRVVVSYFFKFFSLIFRGLLYILTGDKYSYEPVLKKEVVNGVITDHAHKDLIGREDGVVTGAMHKVDSMEKNDKNKKFNFFGYETSYWIIRVYAILILTFFILFEWKDWKPLIFIKIFSNNFLLICFIVLSLWFIEGVFPGIFKRFSRYCSEISTYFYYNKRIKI